MTHKNVRTGSAQSDPEHSKKVPNRDRAGAVIEKAESNQWRRLGSHAKEVLVVEKGRLIRKSA